VSGGDGWISEAEYTSYAKGGSGLATCAWRFSKYDANSNNQWSRAEFDAYMLNYASFATFSDVDTSQGGIISSQEWSTYCASSDKFFVFDSDGDLKLSKSELDAYIIATGSNGMMSVVDANGDGFVSSFEFLMYALGPSALCGNAVYTYRFGKYDADADSRWSSTEFGAYTAAYGGSSTFAAVSGGDGWISEAEYTSYAKSTLSTCAERFSKYDVDVNNQWSKAEFDAYVWNYGGSAAFTDVDTSKGGIISSKEWQTYCTSSDNFAAYDIDGDCKWASTDFSAYAIVNTGLNMFSYYDTNGDGFISNFEWASYLTECVGCGGLSLITHRFGQFDSDGACAHAKYLFVVC
jgi:hypothetical protein